MIQATRFWIRRCILARATLMGLIALAALVGSMAPPRPAHAAEIVPLPGTVHLSVHPGGPSEEITASGKYEQYPSRLEVFVVPGGPFGPTGCSRMSAGEAYLVLKAQRGSPTAAATAAALIQQTLGSAQSKYGDYTVRASWGKGTPAGPYLVCAYLLTPQTPGGQPEDPPDATASARLTIGPAPNPAQPSAIRVVAFYPTTKATFDAYQAGRGGAIPRVSSYAAGTDPVAIFFRFSHARPGATQYTIIITAPHPWDVGIVQGPERLTQTDGWVMATIGSTLEDSVYTNITYYPPGVYKVDLHVDGYEAAQASFRIQPGVVAFFSTTAAALDNSDASTLPRVTSFPAGTAGIGILFKVEGMPAKPTGRFVFQNRSGGASYSVAMGPLPNGDDSACFAYGGGECGARGQPYPPGAYAVDLYLNGHIAARTTFRVGG